MSLTDHLSTSFFVYLLKQLIRNQISAATATVVASVVSDNVKPLFFVVVASTHSYDYSVTYII